jgi:hypothetical protein
MSAIVSVVVPLLRDIIQSETNFLNRVAALPAHERNRLTSNRNRQTAAILDIVRAMVEPQQPRTVRRPFTIDITNDILRSFQEPVPVVPTTEQIREAVEENANPPTDTMCAICQDTMTTSTRLISCNHHFHHTCITQWFGTSVRCPVCRNDIREANDSEL